MITIRAGQPGSGGGFVLPPPGAAELRTQTRAGGNAPSANPSGNGSPGTSKACHVTINGKVAAMGVEADRPEWSGSAGGWTW